ncbi:MAG: hypothetical protein GVY19_13035 [Bacteroidetes bacterium]|jgi:cytosine/adenosine deaminase-related metal-dependent hydrolase|nr:hypothetical protein [Bacteroidota bacterium]
MRKISANYVLPCSFRPVKNGIVVLNNNGVITQLIDQGDEYHEIAHVEFYNGIITPAFILTKEHIMATQEIQPIPADRNKNKDRYLYEQGIIYSEMANHELPHFDIIALINQRIDHETRSFNDVLLSLTLHSAQQLGKDDIYGSLSQHKSPGINLISPFDFDNFRPCYTSKLKRLL